MSSNSTNTRMSVTAGGSGAAAAAVPPKRRRRNGGGESGAGQAGVPWLSLCHKSSADSSRSREASEESNAEMTEDGLGGEDTDTGSLTAAPSSRAARPSPLGPGEPHTGAGAGTSVAEGNVFAHPGNPGNPGQPSAAAAATGVGQKRASPTNVVEQDGGNESTASAYSHDLRFKSTGIY